MSAINYPGRIPSVRNAITKRMMVYASILFFALGMAIFFGFKYRIEREQQQRRARIDTMVAPDAATKPKSLDIPNNTPLPTPPAEVSTPVPAAPQLQPPSVPAIQSYAPQQYGPDPEEVERQEQREREKKAREREEWAMEAPTGMNGAAGTPVPIPNMGSLPEPASSAPTGALPPQSAYERQNDQAGKAAFLKASDIDDPSANYLKANRTPALSRYELWQGSRIQATMDVETISDTPGNVTAQVSRDVYDSETGKCLLIPHGSKLYGEYNAEVAYAQNRLQIAWTRLRMPDGSFIDLGRMNGYDGNGASGLHDQTDNHWKRVIGGALLTSALTAGFQISQNRSNNGSVLAYPSTGQVIGGAIGQQGQELAQQITSRNLSIQPTIKIRPGMEFIVLVSKDICFDKPYQPMEVLSK